MSRGLGDWVRKWASVKYEGTGGKVEDMIEEWGGIVLRVGVKFLGFRGRKSVRVSKALRVARVRRRVKCRTYKGSVVMGMDRGLVLQNSKEFDRAKRLVRQIQTQRSLEGRVHSMQKIERAGGGETGVGGMFWKYWKKCRWGRKPACTGLERWGGGVGCGGYWGDSREPLF